MMRVRVLVLKQILVSEHNLVLINANRLSQLSNLENNSILVSIEPSRQFCVLTSCANKSNASSDHSLHEYIHMKRPGNI
jgi:hypothetical protein